MFESLADAIRSRGKRRGGGRPRLAALRRHLGALREREEAAAVLAAARPIPRESRERIRELVERLRGRSGDERAAIAATFGQLADTGTVRPYSDQPHPPIERRRPPRR